MELKPDHIRELPAITMKIFLTLGLIITLTSCGQNRSVDLEIPDKVEIKKNSSHEQLPGTRVKMIRPKGYQLISSLIRFQKNDNTYIQTVEIPNVNFTERKDQIKKNFQQVEANGLKTYYKKEFKLGDFDALLIYGEDKRPNMDEMVLMFGDATFCVMVAGDFLKGDKEARKEILPALLSTYLDKSLKSDPTVFAKYSLDLSKTKFKYNSSVSQMSYYTIDGTGDPTNDPSVNSILIMTLPAGNNFEERRDYAKSMINRYKTNGIDINTADEQEITINGEKAYEILITGKIKDQPIKAYQVVLGDNKATILFLGMASHDFDEMIKQFQNVATTLRTK